MQLSVRLHPNGLGSGYLHALSSGETIRARILSNAHFHFPAKAPSVVMIANGTGIAPFLGMIDQNHQRIPCYLYGGFRHHASFAVYQKFLEAGQSAGKLTNWHVVYSREGNKQYVSDVLTRDVDFLTNVLQTKGIVMICGSLAMQKDVLTLLETSCQQALNQPLSYFQSHGQVLMDCY